MIDIRIARRRRETAGCRRIRVWWVGGKGKFGGLIQYLSSAIIPETKCRVVVYPTGFFTQQVALNIMSMRGIRLAIPNNFTNSIPGGIETAPELSVVCLKIKRSKTICRVKLARAVDLGLSILNYQARYFSGLAEFRKCWRSGGQEADSGQDFLFHFLLVVRW